MDCSWEFMVAGKAVESFFFSWQQMKMNSCSLLLSFCAFVFGFSHRGTETASLLPSTDCLKSKSGQTFQASEVLSESREGKKNSCSQFEEAPKIDVGICKMTLSPCACSQRKNVGVE